jgi:hypothetical protein
LRSADDFDPRGQTAQSLAIRYCPVPAADVKPIQMEVIGSGSRYGERGSSADQLPRNVSGAPGLGSRTTTAVSDDRSAA